MNWFICIIGFQEMFLLRPTEGAKEMEPNLGHWGCWDTEMTLSMGTLCFHTGGKWNYERRWPFSGPFPHAKHFDPEDGDSMFLQNVSICIQTPRCHNLEDCNMNNRHHENLKAYIMFNKFSEITLFFQSVTIGFLHDLQTLMARVFNVAAVQS
jgi:hypothetical protein